MKWDVKPFRGLGDIEFGMKPEQVRAAVGLTHESFRRNDEPHASDFFAEIGLFAYYTPRGRLEALEMAAPAAPEFGGENLLALPYDQLRKLLAKRDRALDVDDDGCTARGIGVGAYAPESKDHPRKRPEGIIVFRKGYYD